MKCPFIRYKRRAGKKRADRSYVGFLDPTTGTYHRRFSANSLKIQLGESAEHLSGSARSRVEEMARIAISRISHAAHARRGAPGSVRKRSCRGTRQTPAGRSILSAVMVPGTSCGFHHDRCRCSNRDSHSMTSFHVIVYV